MHELRLECGVWLMDSREKYPFVEDDTREPDVRLERIKAAVRICLSPEFLADVDVSGDDAFADVVAMKVKVSLWGLLDSIEKIPLNWWQAVRQRWAPAWWLRRFPVRNRDLKLYQAVYFKPSDDPLFGVREAPVRVYKEAEERET